MLSLFIMIFFLTFSSVSPNKLSISLIFFSLLIGGLSYFFCLALFPFCAITISFSSGMMILFTYCSMMSVYEVKSKKFKLPYFMTLIMFFTFSFCESLLNLSLSSQDQVSLALSSSMAILFLMILVVLTVLCINLTMFNPQKSLLTSYF